ncbi:bifunctional alpha,alpha-trehalose-phosphate synthase (UDP-forming)/trehalose-phosphatase [Candidatus Daviesbacteria bacterium]|nr:bifunctional alpha,alpha-trehalose-phosphate synthase (UDP-forming)/trehalose-phosphatase [Candidatus Daviesbacteria bacterium]
MRLIVVSNRLPFTVVEQNEHCKLIPSTGGLSSSMKSFLTKSKKAFLWVGWPGTAIKRNRQLSVKKKAISQNIVPVFLSEEEAKDFYNGFCNKIIWPLFHYFPAYGSFEENFWQSFREVNEKFCESVLKIVKPNDTVWIHDFQLMLLPKLLRDKMPNLKIGFFLHIPFPSYEVFQLLPAAWRSEILTGLLGADLIGFHTSEYSRHFLGCVLRVLGNEHSLGKLNVNGRVVLVRNFPLGIDVDKFYNANKSKKVIAEKRDLGKSLKGKKVILSIDRLDYTKGIMNRLVGFREFLSKNTSWHKRIVMILIMIPSRIDVAQYEQMKKQIEEMISEINGKYGSIGWTPILYQFHTVSFERLVALYSRSDIALITPLRDGMNLIAKEFVAAQAKKNGVLILSEMAGAAKELTEAILINPISKEEIANAIKVALEMPKVEQVRKLKEMQKSIRKYDVFKWAESFLTSLEVVKKEQKNISINLFNPQIHKKLVSDFEEAKKRLIFLDYDGTLIPFKEKYWEAKPTRSLLKLLKDLAANKKNEVVIISGRDKDTLEKWFGKLPINLVAEHGLLIKERWTDWKVVNHLSTAWKQEALRLLSLYTDQLAKSFIEEKEYSIAWHYRLSDPLQAAIKSKELMDDLVNFTANRNLQILHGNKVIEIKSVYINKGIASSRWFSRQDFDFILAIGDDKTDEDLFSSLPEHAYSIKLGSFISSAKINMENYKQVLKLLSDLIKHS